MRIDPESDSGLWEPAGSAALRVLNSYRCKRIAGLSPVLLTMDPLITSLSAVPLSIRS